MIFSENLDLALAFILVLAPYFLAWHYAWRHSLLRRRFRDEVAAEVKRLVELETHAHKAELDDMVDALDEAMALQQSLLNENVDLHSRIRILFRIDMQSMERASEYARRYKEQKRQIEILRDALSAQTKLAMGWREDAQRGLWFCGRASGDSIRVSRSWVSSNTSACAPPSLAEKPPFECIANPELYPNVPSREEDHEYGVDWGHEYGLDWGDEEADDDDTA